MKKLSILIILLLISGYAFSQKNHSETFTTGEKYILMMNPTVSNINTIDYMVRNNIFHIDSSYHFVGVYHKKQIYDFGKSEKYLNDQNKNRFSLYMIEDSLNNNVLFTKNECSDEFKFLFNNSNGVLFFGGPDIQPEAYGEENIYSVVTDPYRHMVELSFMHHLIGGNQQNQLIPLLEKNKDYVVTGFCLGMQTMNVAAGGTMIQDIPAEIYGVTTLQGETEMDSLNCHRNAWNKLYKDSLLMGASFHPIKFTRHSFFTENIKMDATCKPLVFSYHHQAVEKLGKNLSVTALSMDGKIIEGIAHDIYPHVFGVQFHPEVANLYENLYQRKFKPTDTPKSYHEMIDSYDVVFHLKYWHFISECFK